MKYFSNTLIVVLILTGCVKKATISLPPPEDKLVVTCFLNPSDTMITAVVRKSSPKFSDTARVSYEDIITDASVVISDGQKSLLLTFDQSLSCYKASSAPLGIVSGKKYYLDVRTPDGRHVDANTTVPSGQLTIETFEVRIVREDSTSIDYDVDVVVNDLPGPTNIALFYRNISEDSSFTQPDYYYSPNAFFDSDEIRAAEKYHDGHSDGFYGSIHISSAFVQLSALNCSSEFRLYCESVQRAVLTGGNPFGDPVLVYTNINNGFGCFGAYVENYQKKRVK